METTSLFKKTILIITIWLATLGLASCSSHKSEYPDKTEFQDTELEPANQKTDDSICLWLVVFKSEEDLTKIQKRLRQKEVFALVVNDYLKKNPGKIISNLSCMKPKEMEPVILNIVRNLELGQISEPFVWDQGKAIIMRTTDRYRILGRKLYDQGRYVEAEKQLLKDLELHPHSSPIWQLVGLGRAARGDQQGALKALNKALEFSPDEPGILQDTATTLVYLGKPKEAVPLFEKALQIANGQPLIMSNLAWALASARQNLDRAEDLALRAVETNPGRARFWSTLGLVQQTKGEHASALVSLQKALKLNPKSATTKQRILNSLMALGSDNLEVLAKGSTSYTPLPLKGPKPTPKNLSKKKKPSPKTKARPVKKVNKRKTSKKVYYLQVSSFRKMSLAKKDLRKWRRLKRKPHLDRYKSKKRGKTWITVILGPYPSLAKASKEGKYLKKTKKTSYYRIFSKPKGWRPKK